MVQSCRASYLDGLRGIAALVVVVFHFGGAFLPTAWPHASPDPATGDGAVVFGLLNGVFAVAIFFVMSGFVIAAAADRSAEPFAVLGVRRVLRLGIPVAVTSALAYALILAFPGTEVALSRMSPVGAPPELWGAPSLREAVRMTFLDPWIRGSSALNGSLWTMKTELLGSIAIYAAFKLPERFRIAALAMMFAGLTATGRFWFLGFPIGGLFYAVDLPKYRASIIAIGPMVLGLALATRVDRDGANAVRLTTAATMFVAGVMLNSTARRVLELGVPRWLGRISFGLYLTHEPLLMTIWAAIYLAWMPAGWAALSLLPPYLVMALALGWVAAKYVDEPTLSWIKVVKIN